MDNESVSSSGLRQRVRTTSQDDAAASHSAAGVSEGTAIQPVPTFVDAILQSILTPGAGPGLIATINGALIILIIIVVYLLAIGWADVHMAALLFLAVGLLASVNWFISMTREDEPQASAKQTIESEARVDESAAVPPQRRGSRSRSMAALIDSDETRSAAPAIVDASSGELDMTGEPAGDIASVGAAPEAEDHTAEPPSAATSELKTKNE